MNIRPPAKSRREALSFLAAGSGLVLLSGCTSGDEGQVVLLDSYFTDPENRQAMVDAVAATSLSATTQVGTTNRDTFVASIAGYLRSRPGSVFTWSAGSGLGDLINGGELEHLSAVWTSSDLDPRLRRLSSDATGLPFFVPFSYDPWALFYSRSEWVDAGYKVPATADEVVSLSQVMATDGVAAFGLDRLATPALLCLFDYINLSVNGRDAHRELVQASAADSEALERTLAVVRTLGEIERGLDPGASVSIVPALLSDSATRQNEDQDLGVFVPAASAIVAQVEGFALALPPVEGSSTQALELLARLAEVGPQQAFLGEDSAKLPASLNANYQAMSATSLRVVELIDAASDIVESVAAASQDVATEVTTQLIATVRP